MKKFLLITALLLGATNVYAVGRVYDAYVVDVRVDRNGNGNVRFDRMLTDLPASCMSNHHYHLSFDLNTAAGRAVFDLVTKAKLTNRPVIANGTGTCLEYGVIESWNYGFLR